MAKTRPTPISELTPRNAIRVKGHTLGMWRGWIQHKLAQSELQFTQIQGKHVLEAMLELIAAVENSTNKTHSTHVAKRSDDD